MNDSSLKLLREPKEVIRRVHSLFPQMFRQIEKARWDNVALERAGKIAPRPDFAWGHFPAVLNAINAEISDEEYRRTEIKALKICLPTLAVWRLTQGIYQFDPTLFESLQHSELKGKFPVELLYRLPEWGLYVPLPQTTELYGGIRTVGFFASLWFAPKEMVAPAPGGVQLHIALHLESGEVYPVALWLQGDLNSIMESGFEYLKAHGHPKIDPDPEETSEHNRSNAFIIKLLLYLCSEKPDLSGLVGPPTPQKMRGGEERIFAAQSPHLIEVGYRLGAGIRRARELEGTHDNSGRRGLPKTPHIRKAHYQLYWTGVGRTVPITHWVSAMLVNMPILDEQFSTVRPVKNKESP